MTAAGTAGAGAVCKARHAALVKFTEYITDIEYPFYGQLTPVKTRRPLASIT